MNLLLATYCDMMLSLDVGQKDGKKAISKPIYLLSLFDMIENGVLGSNCILFDNKHLRKRFGELYSKYNHSSKGFELSFFLRPYYHLGSSEFYHLIWKDDNSRPNNANTPSGKYLREHLQYAQFDDDLWNLLQDAESREYLNRNIIDRYLK